MSDYFDRIESHLLDAVERTASPDGVRQSGLRQLRAPNDRHRRPKHTGAVSIISAIVTVAVVGLALGLLNHNPQTAAHSQTNTRPSPHTPELSHSTLGQLLARFAVLRRAQTPPDRSWAPSGEAGSTHQTHVISRLTRLATTLGDGERVFLTVGQARVAANGQAAGSYALNLWVVADGRIVGGEPYSPDVGDYTRSPGPLTWSDHHETWTSIVPDGVQSVRWIFPRGNGLHTHVYPTPLTVDVRVESNVAAARVPRSASWTPAVVIWYGANHQPLMTFRSGNPSRVG